MEETLPIFLTLLLMFGGLLLIIVPSVPVSALEWTIGVVFAALTQFERVTLGAVAVMSVFMLVGATSQFWMPLFGLRGRSISCLGMVAFFAGMIVGGAAIPIPIIGSIVGGVIAVMAVEFSRERNAKKAFRSGKAAFRLVILGMIVELLFSMGIIATFIISVFTTA